MRCRQSLSPLRPALEDRSNKASPFMLASFPASMVNQRSSDLGIPNRFRLNSSRFSALAQYLSKRGHGMEKVRDMIVDDIRRAQHRHDQAHTLTLLHVL